MTYPTIILACHVCEKRDFPDKTRLRRHLLTHGLQYASINGRPRSDAVPAISSKFSVYSCPSCCDYFESLPEVAKHASIHLTEMTSSAGSDNPKQQIDDDNEQIFTIPSSLDVPDLKEPVTDSSQYERRGYHEAILYACQQQNDTDQNKEKTAFIVDTLNLKPFSIVDSHGTEQNALAHPIVIERSISNNTSIGTTLAAKRSFWEMNQNSVCPNDMPASLQALWSTCPYTKLLRKRRYILLSDEICGDLLNGDWAFYANLKYACAQLLAGCIIRNKKNGKAIMANTVEVYGRKKSVDAHREPFGTKKQSALPTSLPPPFETPHPNVWPTTLNTRDGPKLVIGTLSFNALVTSSTRLDQDMKPSVGAITANFQLSNVDDSLASNIFVDEECARKALILAKSEKAVAITNNDIMYQLRQLNTKFNHPSTFYLCRGSGPITQSHQCQPYSMFTLYDFDRGRQPVTKIFYDIGLDVLRNGNQASLSKSLIDECLANSTGKIKAILQDISKLFPSTNSIPILHNHMLNLQLEKLTFLLHSYITTANASVQEAIMQSFTYPDS